MKMDLKNPGENRFKRLIINLVSPNEKKKKKKKNCSERNETDVQELSLRNHVLNLEKMSLITCASHRPLEVKMKISL